MNRKKRYFTRLRVHLPLAGAAVMLLLVQGCATLDRDQCRVADWHLIGYQDGVQGKPAGVIGTYREDCAKHGVTPDLAAWRAGRAEGLKEYCTPANAYRLGRAGNGYPVVCPEPAGAGMQAAYDDGRAIYLARSEVKDTHNRIHHREQRIETLEKEKRDKLADLVSNGLNKEQRVLLLYEIHGIDVEIDDLAGEIDALEHDLHVQQAYLDSLVNTSSR